MSDWAEVYKAKDGWRWRRQAANGKILAESGEAYTNKNDAIVMAERVNVGLEVKVVKEEA